MTRRRWKAIILTVLLLGAMAAGGWWWFGHALPPVTTNIETSAGRSRKLMAIAAREAARISAVDIRLTRLLNLADQQIQRGWKPEATQPLRSCLETLKGTDAERLDEQARISGWVSVSELSREASDKTTAGEACDGAVAALRAIEDPAHRCEYVIGVCNELQYLKGKQDAARVLGEAGAWTKSIDSVPMRRRAVTGFASALFNLDEYEAGERMMRGEDDPAWSSAMLAQLAGQALPASRDVVAASYAPVATPASLESKTGAVPGMTAPGMPGGMFGKQVSYRMVFQNQVRPQTEAPSRGTSSRSSSER